MIDFKPLLEINDKLGIYINLDSLKFGKLGIIIVNKFGFKP